MQLSLGPLMLGVRGTALLPEERDMLRHPVVGGVIFFTRNFTAPEQMVELTREIHALRSPQLLIAVDHEGGRVQRFRQGYTRLPAARVFGTLHATAPQRAAQLATLCGYVMASELRAVGVDFSFAPVLDLDYGVSAVIGDRAFHRDPQIVATLAQASMNGMQRAGMAATGKHFPGHGAVAPDSHLTIAVDERSYADIAQDDLVPFARLINNGLAGIMPAHVIYPACAAEPAGFSPFWLREVLRSRLNFQGVIFSDDLEMEGASIAGNIVARAHAALAAGCDMVLACNDFAAMTTLLDGLHLNANPASHARLARMHGRHPTTFATLHADPAWQQATAALNQLVGSTA